MSVQVSSGYSFGIPPSLGFEPVKELAREFADVLFAGGFTQVTPFKSYEELERSTNTWMVAGAVLLALMAAVFPVTSRPA